MFKGSVLPAAFATTWSAIITENVRLTNRGLVAKLVCSLSSKPRRMTLIWLSVSGKIRLELVSFNISCRTDTTRTMHAIGTGYTPVQGRNNSTHRCPFRVAMCGSFLFLLSLGYGRKVFTTRCWGTTVGRVGQIRLIVGAAAGPKSPTACVVRRCLPSSPRISSGVTSEGG